MLGFHQHPLRPVPKPHARDAFPSNTHDLFDPVILALAQSRNCGTTIAADFTCGEAGLHGALLNGWQIENLRVTNCACVNGISFGQIYAIDIGPNTPLQFFQNTGLAVERNCSAVCSAGVSSWADGGLCRKPETLVQATEKPVLEIWQRPLTHPL